MDEPLVALPTKPVPMFPTDPAADFPPRRWLSDPEVVTVLAHDLRNYLTLVYSRLSMLERRVEREARPEDAKLAAKTIGALELMAAFIDDMLDASRLVHGIYALNLGPVDLTSLVRQTAELFDTDRLPVVAQIAEQIVITGDRERLRQVLHNLLANALQHSPMDAPILLTARMEVRGGRTWAIVTVCDRGSGILPQELAQFFRQYRPRPDSRGLGLGLYLVRRIVEAHGGTLAVQSAAGEGTYVEVALPVRALDGPARRVMDAGSIEPT